MSLPFSALLLFIFCTFSWLKCNSGTEEERIAEDLRVKLGKKKISKDEKRQELYMIESVEALFLKGNSKIHSSLNS